MALAMDIVKGVSSGAGSDVDSDSHTEVAPATKLHKLSDKWVLYAHLPHDTDWTIKSYIPILTVNTIEEAISLSEVIPEEMIKNCMLFIMRGAIAPMWEDTQNRHGGCFSYKVMSKNIKKIWNELFYRMVGNTLSHDKSFMRNITGITISPKKNFCIIKIWMTNCDLQNPRYIAEMDGLDSAGVLFKKHSPEY
jgi:hypothetical protein